MKIVFLCGSLEPGRDGVGDYTRRLAGGLSSLGHTVSAIALNDAATDKIFTGTQTTEGIQLPVLRIPAGSPANERILAAEKWINNFDPEWISLQYVPYAFDKRGLPFSLVNELKKLLKGRKPHIMFHENWLGAERGTGFKQMLVGYLQKKIVQKLNKVLQPAVVHTHLPANQAELKTAGLNAKPLPLFSNISAAAIQENVQQENMIRLGFFSQVETGEAVLNFIALLKTAAVKNKQNFEVLLIGGNAAKMQQAINTIEKEEGLQGCIKYTGFLDAAAISSALQTCTLGITPVPRHAVGKSGSVAAFLAHGIPVAAPNVHYRYKPADIGFFSPAFCAAIVTAPDINLLAPAKQAALLANHEINLPVITNQFLADLQYSAHV